MVKKNVVSVEKIISEETKQSLKVFQNKFDVFSKGKLSLVIQLTREAMDKKFPLEVSDFQTDNKGQVSGISGAKLKRILKDHGITRRLTSEGGRTSRGNMGLMIEYIKYLNNLNAQDKLNIQEVENYWAQEVRQYFNSQPFILPADLSKTVQANFEDLFKQAEKREKQSKGTKYLGIMLQQLVAAKLQIILPDDSFAVHGTSVADAPINRLGDFVINNTSIHCTTMPNEILMEKCESNISEGISPIIMTIYESVPIAKRFVKVFCLEDRVEVWDVQQFLSTNVLERSLFEDKSRNSTLKEIIDRYNNIIEEVENDPSLRIEFNMR